MSPQSEPETLLPYSVQFQAFDPGDHSCYPCPSPLPASLPSHPLLSELIKPESYREVIQDGQRTPPDAKRLVTKSSENAKRNVKIQNQCMCIQLKALPRKYGTLPSAEALLSEHTKP